MTLSTNPASGGGGPAARLPFAGTSRAWAGMLSLPLAACTGGSPAVASDPPIVMPEAATPASAPVGLRVVLSWQSAVDLDLYVTDPEKETVYFANPRSASGGVLDEDLRCAQVLAPGADRLAEVVHWPAPAEGVYRVGVDFSDRCEDSPTEVTYRLVVEDGDRRRETEGTVTFEKFEPLVLEVDVGGMPAEQTT